MTGIATWVPIAVAATVMTGLLALRARMHPGSVHAHWAARAFLASPVLGALCGGLCGWAAPAWVAQPTGQLLAPALVFLLGWVGMASGCSLDLRVVRRGDVVGFLHELFQAAAATALVLAVAFVASGVVPAATRLPAAALLVLAAVCVAGAPLPLDRSGLTRNTSRGFWSPSLSPVLAALLAALGTSLGPNEPFHVTLPFAEGTRLLAIEGVGNRLLWVMAAGCAAGLLADLATREDFASVGLYPPIFAVILVASGVAGAIGLEPALVCAVAGFWLINATLRRLDVLRVLERGAPFPRLASFFLTGWLVGAAFEGEGVDPSAFGLALLLVLGLRPLVRLTGARLARRAGRRRRRGQPEPPATSPLEVGELGLLLAAILTRVLAAPLAAGAIGGVLVGHVALAGVARWREQRRRAA